MMQTLGNDQKDHEQLYRLISHSCEHLQIYCPTKKRIHDLFLYGIKSLAPQLEKSSYAYDCNFCYPAANQIGKWT